MSDEHWAQAQIEKVLTRGQAALEREGGYDHRVLLDFGAAGAVLVDGPGGAVGLSAGDTPADAVIRVSLEDFLAMAKGRLSPMKAALTGKVKLEGDAGIALALAKRLGDV